MRIIKKNLEKRKRLVKKLLVSFKCSFLAMTPYERQYKIQSDQAKVTQKCGSFCSRKTKQELGRKFLLEHLSLD